MTRCALLVVGRLDVALEFGRKLVVEQGSSWKEHAKAVLEITAIVSI
jgi:hypothetical protein